MDIIFHEIVPFFSPSHPHLQEETRGVYEDDVTIPLLIPPYSFDVDRCHSKGEQVIIPKEKAPTQEKGWVKDFTNVFVKKRQKVASTPHVPLQLVTSSPCIASFILLDDSHSPIVVRKSTRACTQHPIATYMYNDSLSPEFRAFSTSLSFVSILCSVSQALYQPQ